ncbi:Guanine nucleotide-binding protein subunit gamma [Sphaceloma murrayae]|uniref:Guanine nucleotide-binding protein subunit gamma n=1 Tax=Sphaceloma murrayae TaxID=2082308 RepID=A0A2K1QQM7_9PEZI|nr:Guanine nucleotide-binding protein subunit gamma [Sphaceloma murrayae]
MESEADKAVAKGGPPAGERLEAQVKSADMSEDMQQESIDVAQEAMSKFNIEKDIAHHIKKTVWFPLARDSSQHKRLMPYSSMNEKEQLGTV